MSNIILNSVLISFIYLILKFIEMRFLLKEDKPLKDLLRDSLFVYISILAGMFLLEQFKYIINENKVFTKDIKIFNDEPGF